MKSLWLYPIILIAGALQALGVSMNAQLKTVLINPWLASLISFAPIVIVLAVIWCCQPQPLPTPSMWQNMPWWAPLGGLAGAVAVFLGLTMVDKIGAGPLNGLIITANIITSLLIDHFGLLRMPAHQASPLRVVGAMLMVAGITLIVRN
jgi:transporter family-2 protein